MKCGGILNFCPQGQILGVKGQRIFGSTGKGDKLDIFGDFFVLLQTPPTVLIGKR